MRGCDVGRFRREIDLPASFRSVWTGLQKYVASAASEQNLEHRSKVCENSQAIRSPGRSAGRC